MDERAGDTPDVVSVSGRNRVLRGGGASTPTVLDESANAPPPFQGERSSERGLLSAIWRTLERRLSSENLVRNAVVLRDALSSLYNSGRQSTRNAFLVAGRTTASAYHLATNTLASADLPWPLHTVRDVAIMPAVRGLENTVIFIVTPGTMQGVYSRIRDRSERVPLVGPFLLTPTFNVVEQGVAVALGATRVTLMIVAAPIPSRETVTYLVTTGYNGVAQGVEITGDVLRETYYYARLIDVQIQRAVNRVQWDLLGNGPYLELLPERRAEVRDRLCDRYLATSEPLRRYELLMALRLHNASLWEELIHLGPVLRLRGGLDFEDDPWLDLHAPWRRRRKKRENSERSVWQEGGFGIYSFPLGAIEPEAYKHRLSQAEGSSLPGRSDSVDYIPLHQWFVAPGALPGEYEVDTESRWIAFSVAESCRLEAHYAQFLTNLAKRETFTGNHFPDEIDGIGGALGSLGLGLPKVSMPRSPDQRFPQAAGAVRDLTPHGIDSDSFITDSIVRVLAKRRTQRSCLYQSSPTPFQSNAGFDVPVEQGRHVVNLVLGRLFPVYWRFMEPPLDADVRESFSADPENDDMDCSPGMPERLRVPSEGGPKTRRSRDRCADKPNAFLLGEKVIRAMWLIEKAKPRRRQKARSKDRNGEAADSSGIQEEQEEAEYTWETQPLPPLSAAILEDAYQFLRWHLAHQTPTKAAERRSRESSGDVLQQTSGDPSDPVEEISSAYHPSRDVFEELSKEEGDTRVAGQRGHGDKQPSRFAGWLRKRETALLTITILDWNGTPLLAQFRSLTEIVASRRNFSSSLIPFARYRIYRGHPSATRNEEGRSNGKLGFSRYRSIDPDSSMRSPLGSRSASLPGEPQDTSIDAGDIGSMKKVVVHDLDEPVEHLVLVVHGIGEALEANDMGVIQLRSLVQCCNQLRRNHDTVCDANLQMFGTRDFHGRGRVEFLPVEWHTRFHRHIDRPPDALTIHDITLHHIPLFRQFANDAFLDILYFVSSTYHKAIVSEVVWEMNRVVTLFKQRTPSWSGKVSIAAHSLGAIISFDVLANQLYASVGACKGRGGDLREAPGAFAFAPGAATRSQESPSVASNRNDAAESPKGKALFLAGASENGVHGDQENLSESPRLVPGVRYPALCFQPGHLFCLGSPIGAFVMLRRLTESFHRGYRLPGGVRLYNIFHPYDPVAFRLEPIVMGGAFVSRHPLPPPQLVPTWQGGYRMQYKMRQLWRRMVEMPAELTQQGYRLVERSLTTIGLLDADLHNTDVEKVQETIRAASRASPSHSYNEKHKSSTTTNLKQRVAPASPRQQGSGLLRGRKSVPALPDEVKSLKGGGDGNAARPRPLEMRSARRFDPATADEVDHETGGEDVPFFGRLNDGDRIDYALQEKEIEITNEYVFAIGAHVIYWSSKDLSYFIAEQLLTSTRSSESERVESRSEEAKGADLAVDSTSSERSASTPEEGGCVAGSEATLAEASETNERTGEDLVQVAPEPEVSALQAKEQAAPGANEKGNHADATILLGLPRGEAPNGEAPDEGGAPETQETIHLEPQGTSVRHAEAPREDTTPEAVETDLLESGKEHGPKFQAPQSHTGHVSQEIILLESEGASDPDGKALSEDESANPRAAPSSESERASSLDGEPPPGIEARDTKTTMTSESEGAPLPSEEAPPESGSHDKPATIPSVSEGRSRPNEEPSHRDETVKPE
uniref:DDHD domain-containing protein n=1 Tax=Pinguiococcus pyrenoidosus TaxID=172671 RepID=A0A7R9YCD7_9STRA|mmetsp:Transcript_1908/g.8448  ORF Transcript_1908/g.8448 Transcript_1908/m.8448 type:complete len:1700 (+) Transcript_1908:74-5173(+)